MEQGENVQKKGQGERSEEGLLRSTCPSEQNFKQIPSAV